MLEKLQHRALRLLSVLRVKLLDSGPPPVVYGLLVDVIGVVIVIVVVAVATQLQGGFSNAADLFPKSIP